MAYNWCTTSDTRRTCLRDWRAGKTCNDTKSVARRRVMRRTVLELENCGRFHPATHVCNSRAPRSLLARNTSWGSCRIGTSVRKRNCPRDPLRCAHVVVRETRSTPRACCALRRGGAELGGAAQGWRRVRADAIDGRQREARAAARRAERRRRALLGLRGDRWSK